MTPLRSRSLLAGLLLAVFGISVLPGAAAAGPKANLNQVQRQVDQLNHQAEQAAERYNTAKVKLTDTTRQLRAARNKYAATQRRLDAMKVLVGRIAVASYKSGGLDSSVQLLLSDDPTEFLRQAADLTQVTKHQDHLLVDMQAARLSAAVDRKAVAEKQARAQDLQGEIAAEKRTIEGKLATAQALLGRLEAKQRAQLMSIRQAATDRALGARSDAMRASRSSRDGDFPTYDGPASGRAAVAVKTAFAQLGDPYQWGAAGPGSFDCSGLTMYSWGAAGVSLPHSSSAQYSAVPHVSISNLQPGDLVFYYSPISHVGIYIGGGRVIDAPYPGLSVHISGLYSMPLVGAGRP
ncbi:MAG: peptidoglycan DL-endopeptidase CwlO [Actinomycetota bacterium]|jgi:cell wall-associated NlpC family hydrolase|nr:peptidoglycan DL-endopeptidase CwlO [Actinomycetota bacterium]